MRPLPSAPSVWSARSAVRSRLACARTRRRPGVFPWVVDMSQRAPPACRRGRTPPFRRGDALPVARFDGRAQDHHGTDERNDRGRCPDSPAPVASVRTSQHGLSLACLGLRRQLAQEPFVCLGVPNSSQSCDSLRFRFRTPSPPSACPELFRRRSIASRMFAACHRICPSADRLWRFRDGGAAEPAAR